MGKGRKCRCKCKVSQKARVRKKSEQPKDTIPRMQARTPADVGASLKFKIKKK